MSIPESLDQRFRERAVELMRGIGVPGVTLESLLTLRAHREQYRAMLVDARSRHAVDTESFASIERLIFECDHHNQAEPAMEAKPGEWASRGTGFQIPRLDEPRPVRAMLPRDFCRYCGAGIPPKFGEGTCHRCDTALGGDPEEARRG